MVDFPCYYTADTDKVPDMLKPHLPFFSTGRCECVGVSFSPYIDIKTARRRRKKLSRKRFVKLMMGRRPHKKPRERSRAACQSIDIFIRRPLVAGVAVGVR